MEPGTPILVSCPDIGLKNHPGTLAGVSPHGYYQVNLDFGERGIYSAYLPIAGTALLARDPVAAINETMPGIER